MIPYDVIVHGLCRTLDLPTPEAEWRFAYPRRWRFDFAWVAWKVALEIDGGVWVKGRHTRGSGFVKDMEKFNEAAARGWRIVRCVPNGIPDAMAVVKRCLRSSESE